MHAVHVIAGIRQKDGGPAYSVPRLCRSLVSSGIAVDLLTVAENGGEEEKSEGRYRERRFHWDGARIPVIRAMRASSGLARELRRQSAAAQIIHNHGLWLLPNVYAGREARRAEVPLVLAPRGMLSSVALSFSSVRKRVFWRLLQARAVTTAACFHATSEDEYRDIRAFGLRQPIAVIRNGIDIYTGSASRKLTSSRRVALSLGRLHPKKGLDNLVRAWREIEMSHPDWHLRIIGPSESGYASVLDRLVTELSLSRVSVEGPAYGADKERALEGAELFILPTRNENFAVTVAESLASGLPVIATKGSPWPGLIQERCGWWVDQGVGALAAALANALALPRDDLAAMGARGRDWMARDFSWERVASDMVALYRWLTNAGERPQFVRLD